MLGIDDSIVYSVIRKTCDADFETVMKSVDFSNTPREFVTVRDMISYHNKAVKNGTEEQIYG